MDLSGIDGKIPTKRNIGRTVLNMDILMIVMMMMIIDDFNVASNASHDKKKEKTLSRTSRKGTER